MFQVFPNTLVYIPLLPFYLRVRAMILAWFSFALMCLASRFCFPFWLGSVQPLRVTVLNDIPVRRRFLFMGCEIDGAETLCG